MNLQIAFLRELLITMLAFKDLFDSLVKGFYVKI